MEKEKPQSGTEHPARKRPWNKPQISNMNGPIVVYDDAGETVHYRNPS